MAKIISLFNHKGGVSKTTTTFHLGAMLTKLGQKVLIVDADPQCNLTGLVLGIDEELFEFYNSKQNYDIYNSLATAFGFPTQLKDVSKEGIPNPTKTKEIPGLYLIAGHVDFAKFDLQLATAMLSSTSIPLLKPLLGSINSLIRKTAERHDFDVVLVDMSPNISATNMSIFMASDYFIVPTSPDFFCYQSIDSLSKVFPDWSKRLKDFKDGETLPKPNPKMLGVISQNYRAYNTNKKQGEEMFDSSNEDMSKEYKKWADKIREITNRDLVKILKEQDMVIDEKLFRKFVDYDEPYNLANIKDFNSLVAISQRLSKPIFDIVQKDTPWSGSVWAKEKDQTGAKYAILRARKVYKQMSTAVANMIGLEIKEIDTTETEV